jgi:hypothetical protein
MSYRSNFLWIDTLLRSIEVRGFKVEMVPGTEMHQPGGHLSWRNGSQKDNILQSRQYGALPVSGFEKHLENSSRCGPRRLHSYSPQGTFSLSMILHSSHAEASVDFSGRNLARDCSGFSGFLRSEYQLTTRTMDKLGSQTTASRRRSHQNRGPPFVLICAPTPEHVAYSSTFSYRF